MDRPDSIDAEQFAIILESGAPPDVAITYFYPDLSGVELVKEMKRWLKHDRVKREISKLEGTAWEKRTLTEKIHFSLDKFYREAAFFLYRHNVGSLVGVDLQKAQTFRQILETKVAGLAGKQNALETFFNDLLEGKLNGPQIHRSRTQEPSHLPQIPSRGPQSDPHLN